jgi:hypothetical protein
MLTRYAVKLAIFGLEVFRLDELTEHAKVPATTAASVLEELPREWLGVFKSTWRHESNLAPTYRLTPDGRQNLAYELCAYPDLLPRVLASPFNGTTLVLGYVRNLIGLLPSMPRSLQQVALRGIEAQLASTEECLMVGLDASGRKAFEGTLRLEELCKLEQLMKLKGQVSLYRRACGGTEVPQMGTALESNVVTAGAFA